jgi:hypothetical protein
MIGYGKLLQEWGERLGRSKKDVDDLPMYETERELQTCAHTASIL